MVQLEYHLHAIQKIIEERLIGEVGIFREYSFNSVNSHFDLSGQFQSYDIDSNIFIPWIIPNRETIERDLKISILKYLEYNSISNPLIITTEAALGCYPNICLKFIVESNFSLSNLFPKEEKSNYGN